MKWLFALFLLCLSTQVVALEVAGIILPETVQVGNTVLQLNGAGIRSRFFFRVYAAALYLPIKKHAADAILADGKEYRMTMHILRELSGDKLLGAFNDAIAANHSASELAKLDTQLKQMAQIFTAVHEVRVGDIITLDYLPDSGTRITINGTTRGTISGAQFSRALLRVWLGNVPVQADLKKGLLGG